MMKNSVDFAYVQRIYTENAEKFEKFRALLLEYNEKFNLTSITDGREMLKKHFYDSLAGEILFEKGANVIEIGSGGGFPSIPLKIVREDLSFTLVESTGKKCEFLRAAVKELGLENVTVLNARAEDLGKDPSRREKYDICCARAVARLNTLCEYCLPLVKTNGKMIAYKGRAEEETAEAAKAIRVLGGGKTEIISYELPEEAGERTLVSIIKEGKTPEKYPRGNGKERKNPIL